LAMLGGAYNRLGNFSKALEYYLEQLKLLEKKADPYDITDAYLSIALAYNSEKDIEKALHYAYKADSTARANNLSNVTPYTTLDIGDIYSNSIHLDSALSYTTRSYDESVRQKNYLITGTALNNMGNIYFKGNQFEKSVSSFRASIPYIQSMQDYNTLAECELGLARSFDKLDMPDSALEYARRSFMLASENGFLKHAVPASAFLSQLYKRNQHVDSAFAYQAKFINLKDSLANTEKIKQLQSLTISEQLRQQEIAQQKIRDKKDRRLKLELLLVGIFIPVFFLVSAVLSRKKVHRKIIEFSGILSLLLLFEYIVLLVNPLVANAADHSPVLEILMFVGFAAVLTPTHHKIEHWFMAKLIHRHQMQMQPLPGPDDENPSNIDLAPGEAELT
ncbi:MAG: tetratricopeptide repeat protein, partial [Flavisolibacter sp.]